MTGKEVPVHDPYASQRSASETRTHAGKALSYAIRVLEQGKAVLYATFQNDKIGVTLGVSVDGDGKSYISVDYKDFALMDSEQQTILNKTIEDL